MAQSEVWSQLNAQLIAESKWINNFNFSLIFGLSPNLELSETLSERLIQKVKRLSVDHTDNVKVCWCKHLQFMSTYRDSDMK